MKLIRPALAIAIGSSLAVAGAAGAVTKPKPVCNLVKDAAGDSSVYPGGGFKDDALDIVSADVASNKASITAVLRVKKLAKSSTYAPYGLNWTVNFTAEGTVFSLAGHTTATGAVVFDTAYQTKTGGSLYGAGTTGVFDTAKNEVRITTPLELMAKEADIRVGKTKITDINARTGGEVLVPDATGLFGSTLFSDSEFEADSATGTKTYLAGAASCVAVGK